VVVYHDVSWEIEYSYGGKQSRFAEVTSLFRRSHSLREIGRDKLRGGDLRSIGRANEVVEDVLQDQTLFGDLISGMKSSDPVIRMRSADVVEKVARTRPELLVPYKEELICKIPQIDQQEIRWHLAQIYTYMTLSNREEQQVVELLFAWISQSKSKIVKVNAMESLAHFAKSDPHLKGQVVRRLNEIKENGSAAERVRARKLLTILPT